MKLPTKIWLLLLILFTVAACEHDQIHNIPEDGMLVWEQIAFDSTSILALASHPEVGILASDRNHRLFRSPDNGETWTTLTADFSELVFKLAINHNGDIYAATSRGIHTPFYRSVDHGHTWQRVMLPHGFWILDVNFNVRGDIFFVATGEESPRGWMYRSRDHGDTWQEIIFPALYAFDLEIASNGYFYIATEKGVYGSGNEGDTWLNLSAGLPGGFVERIATSRSGIAYASVFEGIFRASKPGELWLPTALTKGCMDILFIAPQGYVLAADGTYDCRHRQGVYLSRDGGTHWTHLNSGLPSKVLSSFLVTAEGDVFVGISNHGLFRVRFD